MNIWDYLSQNGDPKRTLGSLPQKSVNWNYTVPSDNTRTPSASTTGVYYPNMKKEMVITPQTRQNYYRTGGKEYDPNYTNPYEPYNFSPETWNNIGKFAGSVTADPIGLAVSAYDFIKDPSWLNLGALGLDAITPGNVGGFLKGVGEIGIGTAATRELTKKGIGRIVTNLVPPMGYENKIRELVDMYKQKGFQPLAKSVINDIPAYEILVPDREFPYRKMYGLEPRDVNVYSHYEPKSYSDYEDIYGPKPDINYAINGQGNFGDDFTYEGIYPNPIKNSDGTYTLDKNSLAYKEASDIYFPSSLDYLENQTINSYNQLFGGYSVNWDPRKGEALAVDDWDFNLHPGEFKKGWKEAKKNYDFAKEVRNLGKAKNIKVDTSWSFLNSLIDSGEILSTNALRYAMSKITDPVKYRVPLDIANNSDLNDHITHSFLRKFGRASEWNVPNDFWSNKLPF